MAYKTGWASNQYTKYIVMEDEADRQKGFETRKIKVSEMSTPVYKQRPTCDQHRVTKTGMARRFLRDVKKSQRFK